MSGTPGVRTTVYPSHLLPDSIRGDRDFPWESLVAWVCARCGQAVSEFNDDNPLCRVEEAS